MDERADCGVIDPRLGRRRRGARLRPARAPARAEERFCARTVARTRLAHAVQDLAHNGPLSCGCRSCRPRQPRFASLLADAGRPTPRRSPLARGRSARAFAIRVTVPGQAGAVDRAGRRAARRRAFGGAFAYPADGSIVPRRRDRRARPRVDRRERRRPRARRARSARSSLFGGEITAQTVTGRAVATADATARRAATSPARRSRPRRSRGAAGRGRRRGQRASSATGATRTCSRRARRPTDDGYRGFVDRARHPPTADHGGLPAGSEILVGYAEAAAPRPPPPPAPPTTATAARRRPPAPAGTTAPGRRPERGRPKARSRADRAADRAPAAPEPRRRS